MTEGTSRRPWARHALAGIAGLALAGIVGAGHAETAIGEPVALVAPALAASDARFQPSPEALGEVALAPPAATDVAAASVQEEIAGTPLGSGVASFYGRAFAGRPTASGERFDPQQHTAAHRTLPFGSKVRVTNSRNGRSVVVRINDRGPFTGGRLIDLSRGAAEEIGIISAGHGKVEIELLS